MKTVFNLVDGTFTGQDCSVRGKSSRYIHWDRGCGSAAPTFYVDHMMLRDDIVESPEGAFGWLLESKKLIPSVYQLAQTRLYRFKKVFTHDWELLKMFPDQCVYAPSGGIWLGGSVGGGSIGIKEKTKNISLVSSDKLHNHLHAFRYRLALRLKNSSEVDVYGTACGAYVPIAETVEPYRFSIAIENDCEPYRFTEKILNCFAAGTVPIYVGATQIAKFFNTEGIIQTTPENIMDAIRMAKPEFYHGEAVQKAIQENFNLCLKYETIEDYLWEKYFS